MFVSTTIAFALFRQLLINGVISAGFITRWLAAITGVAIATTPAGAVIGAVGVGSAAVNAISSNPAFGNGGQTPPSSTSENGNGMGY